MGEGTDPLALSVNFGHHLISDVIKAKMGKVYIDSLPTLLGRYPRKGIQRKGYIFYVQVLCPLVISL